MHKWMKSGQHLRLDIEERVARITLNNPARRNALSWDMRVELRGALLEADDLRELSAIVLRGAGPDSCCTSPSSRRCTATAWPAAPTLRCTATW